MEDFVTFEMAKKLKEKGFNNECHAYYEPLKHCLNLSRVFSTNSLAKYYNCITAPTIPQVLKWLREEKKLYVEPCILADADTDADGKVINEYIYWSFSITNIETGDMIYFEYEHIDDKRFDSYEESAINGINYVLDNLI